MTSSRRIVLVLAAAVLIGGAALAWTILAGAYNIGADDAHTRPVSALLETVRQRSVAAGARSIAVPDLSDPAKAIQGAGNYNAMCASCHLTPVSGPSELSRGLYPTPPDLTKVAIQPAEAFWAIKHGIKASGMPSWGKSMGDDFIWNMVAFLQTLPSLDGAKYKAMVAHSGGHSHGGGESHTHDAAEESEPHSHAAHEAAPTGGSKPEEKPHHHDGASDVHAKETDAPKVPRTHVDASNAPPHHHEH